MNRAPQQRPLNHAALFERGREGIAPKVAHARPEADVPRWRVLRLEPTNAFERGDEWQGRALEQELAREQCPIELARGQDALYFARSVKSKEGLCKLPMADELPR